MSKTILAVAPHPDDESLGCGGTLLKHKARGDSVHWLIMTGMRPGAYSPERMKARAKEIKAVAARYGFAGTHALDFPTATLDTLPLGDLIGKVSEVMKAVRPQIVYAPYGGDVHSDHRVTFEVVASCTKSFRYPSVERVLVYEALSETDFAIDPDAGSFRPNSFSDITAHLEKKIEILKLFKGEMGTFPFPRSEKAVRALAAVRGAAGGFEAAEAFMLLRERF